MLRRYRTFTWLCRVNPSAGLPAKEVLYLLKDQVLEALRAGGQCVSGQDLCRRLGVTRAAVWKAIQALREEGYLVRSLPGRGYRLGDLPDVLNSAEILAELPASCRLRELHCFASLPSTNDLARKLAIDGAPHGTVVVSGSQTAGRGRMGRSFFSPEGGLYLSVLLRPQTYPETLLPLTAFTAVAICDAVQRLTGVRPRAKWPNDLLISGKKLCGVLTEASIEAESGAVRHVVVGIGLNLSQSTFPPELEGVATSLLLSGVPVPRRASLCASILEHLEMALRACFDESRGVYLSRYLDDCATIGQAVTQTRGDTVRRGVAESVDSSAALLVRFDDGSLEAVNSGEVTLSRP